METTQEIPDVMKIARTASVIIGSKQSVLNKLKDLYPLSVKMNAKFYSDMTFEEQIEKLLTFNKYKNSDFIYGILYFYENDISPEREEIANNMNLPDDIRNYRIQRVELHR
jgi:hypothetical protein